MTTEETEKTEEIDHTTENLESVGQMIIGGIEQIGGILTGDPYAHAEGAFNVEAGVLHQESNRALDAIEENETAETEPHEEIKQTPQ